MYRCGCCLLWCVFVRCDVLCAELSKELNGAHFSVADVTKDAELEKAVKEAAEQVTLTHTLPAQLECVSVSRALVH